MKKILAVLLTVCLGAVALSFTGCNKSTTPVVGLICLHGESSTYDKNFIDAFKTACENKGLSEDEYIIATDIGEDNSCYEKAIEFVNMGCKAVFADSFDHEGYLLQAAKEHADVTFCHATGTQAHTEKLDNFYNAFASIYEGRYLAGIAGGLKLKELYNAGTITTKDFIIGYVGAKPYEEVKSGYTAFYLGVKSITDTIEGSTLTMKVKFTNSWYDEIAERETANALIGAGAMLISQHADSMGAPSACEDKNIPNVSYNGSTATACPKTFIVSSKINWTPYFEMMIDKAMGKGTLPVDYIGSIEDGAVALTELGASVASGTAEAIEEAKAKFASGTLKVFDVSKFTVNGAHITEYMANVDSDANFTPDTNVVKTENGITFVAESDPAFRSAPYFGLDIDGIEIIQ